MLIHFNLSVEIKCLRDKLDKGSLSAIVWGDLDTTLKIQNIVSSISASVEIPSEKELDDLFHLFQGKQFEAFLAGPKRFRTILAVISSFLNKYFYSGVSQPSWKIAEKQRQLLLEKLYRLNPGMFSSKLVESLIVKYKDPIEKSYQNHLKEIEESPELKSCFASIGFGKRETALKVENFTFLRVLDVYLPDSFKEELEEFMIYKMGVDFQASKQGRQDRLAALLANPDKPFMEMLLFSSKQESSTSLKEALDCKEAIIQLINESKFKLDGVSELLKKSVTQQDVCSLNLIKNEFTALVGFSKALKNKIPPDFFEKLKDLIGSRPSWSEFIDVKNI